MMGEFFFLFLIFLLILSIISHPMDNFIKKQIAKRKGLKETFGEIIDCGTCVDIGIKVDDYGMDYLCPKMCDATKQFWRLYPHWIRKCICSRCRGIQAKYSHRKATTTFGCTCKLCKLWEEHIPLMICNCRMCNYGQLGMKSEQEKEVKRYKTQYNTKTFEHPIVVDHYRGQEAEANQEALELLKAQPEKMPIYTLESPTPVARVQPAEPDELSYKTTKLYEEYMRKQSKIQEKLDGFNDLDEEHEKFSTYGRVKDRAYCLKCGAPKLFASYGCKFCKVYY